MLALHGNKLQGAVQNNLFLISYANVVAVFFEIRFDFRYRVIGQGCTLSSGNYHRGKSADSIKI